MEGNREAAAARRSFVNNRFSVFVEKKGLYADCIGEKPGDELNVAEAGLGQLAVGVYQQFEGLK